MSNSKPSTRIPNLFSVQEAARDRHVSVSLLQKLTASREVTSYRIGRRCYYRPEELKAEFMERATHKREGGAE